MHKTTIQIINHAHLTGFIFLPISSVYRQTIVDNKKFLIPMTKSYLFFLSHFIRFHLPYSSISGKYAIPYNPLLPTSSALPSTTRFLFC